MVFGDNFKKLINLSTFVTIQLFFGQIKFLKFEFNVHSCRTSQIVFTCISNVVWMWLQNKISFFLHRIPHTYGRKYQDMNFRNAVQWEYSFKILHENVYLSHIYL